MPSVLATTPYEVVVADNGSDDGSLEFLRTEYPSVDIVALDKNYGFAEGYNRALASVEADYYVLLNSDVETLAGWCEPLAEVLEDDLGVVAVQPKILSLTEPDKFEYAGAAGGFIDALGYPFCRGRILSAVEEDNGQYDDRRDVFWVSGACMMIRAQAFHDLGGFDARFFAHMEEIDLCWRAARAGWRVAVEPRSVVRHLGGGTLATGSERKIYLNFRNSLLMLHKNRGAGVVRRRMFLDGGSALVYVLTGRLRFARAVWRAHRDFRRLRQHYPPAPAEARRTAIYGIYRGSILLRYFFGRHRFGRMM